MRSDTRVVSATITVWRPLARSMRRLTPLWLYVLAESASRGRGEQLVPCGGRIVAEVLIGILEADRGSYRANEPSWTPTLPTGGQRFGLTRLLLATDARCG